MQGADGLGCSQQGYAASWDDALFDRGFGRMNSVVDAVLALLDFRLGGTADLDDGDTPCKLREALRKLFAIVV
jgi:hypothetical protein